MSDLKNYAHLFNAFVIFYTQGLFHNSFHLEPDERRSNYSPPRRRNGLGQVEAYIAASSVKRIFNEHPVGCRELPKLDGAVVGEPVSEARFPANREKNRELRENRAVWQKAARQNVAKSAR
jgi:hypothetical protein